MNTETIYPLSKIDPKDTKIEFSCRCMRPVMVYLERKYGKKAMEEFIASTKMNLHYIKDRNNWISYDYFCRIMKDLVKYTGNANVAFDIGKETTKNGCYGILERFFCKLGTLPSTYSLVAHYSDRMTKVDTFKVSELHKNGCTVTVTMFPGYKQDKNNCLNLQGVFTSIPYALGLPYAKVTEQACAVDGAPACEYAVTWTNKPTMLFGLTGMMIGLAAIFVSQLLGWKYLNSASYILVPIVGYFCGRFFDCKNQLTETRERNKEGNEDLVHSIATIERLNVELQEKVEMRTAELSKSNKELNKALQELKESQEQLIHSEKMASVGYLAAGMAHELNNPVGAIRNYIQDVLEDLEEHDPRAKALKLAEKATGRCGRIVKDLLTFSRESKNLEMIDINEIVNTVLLTSKEELQSKNIEITLSPGKDILNTEADLLQIQQVVTNLVTNASQAIERNGKIGIKTYQDTGNLYVEVSDTGGGILEENKSRIFDPFFTTKAPGKGQGLGLAISYNIIKRFGGGITVDSTPGEGAVFTIKLPISN